MSVSNKHKRLRRAHSRKNIVLSTIKHMRRAFLLFLIFGLVVLSCKKKNQAVTLFDGTWHMWYVKDRQTGAVTPKPSNNPDVILRFKSLSDTTGTFSGSTPANQVFSNSYLLSGLRVDHEVGDIKIPSLSMSNAPDSIWGRLLADNFTKAKKFAFENERSLFIYTTDSMLITFKRQ
jgi:hypothetical protein